METLSAFCCAASPVLAAPCIHHDLIAVSVSARVGVPQLFHSSGTTMTTVINCTKRSIEWNSGTEAINLAADKLFIGFEKYTITILSLDQEYHIPHVQSQFIWSNVWVRRKDVYNVSLLLSLAEMQCTVLVDPCWRSFPHWLGLMLFAKKIASFSAGKCLCLELSNRKA